MRLSAVVEPRCDVQLERHLTPHAAQQPHQPVPICGHLPLTGMKSTTSPTPRVRNRVIRMAVSGRYICRELNVSAAAVS